MTLLATSFTSESGLSRIKMPTELEEVGSASGVFASECPDVV